MGKKIAIGAGALLLVIVVGVAVVLGQLGRIIKRGVETYGPPITGTTVSLSGAHVSIFDGTGSLSRLKIGNPKGYSDDDAFNLTKIAIALDPKSVTSAVVHVRSIVIDGPELLAEFDANGKSNLSRILDNVKGSSGTSAGSGKSGGGSGKQARLSIDEFRFTNGQVRVTAPAFNLDRTVKLPPIEQRNIGGKGGATPSEAANQILRPVIDAALQAAMNQYLKAQRDKLGDQAKDKLLNKLFK